MGMLPNQASELNNDRNSCTYWKILTKKMRFFGARFTLKISIYWRQGAFRTIIESVGLNGFF